MEKVSCLPTITLKKDWTRTVKTPAPTLPRHPSCLTSIWDRVKKGRGKTITRNLLCLITTTLNRPDPSSNSENTSDDHAQKLVGVVKTPASKNALVHGLYAADILLPWESEEEFETLFRELQEDW